MSPERDKTHRHGLTCQAACKGQPRARQHSRQPGRKAGQHVHLRHQALPGRHLSPQGTRPSDSRSQAWPEGCWRISKCPGRSLLPVAGRCMHTRRSQPSHGTKLNTCRWLPSRSHQSPAPALLPCARALPSTSKHGAPRSCCGCPASSPASAPLHPCSHPAPAGARTGSSQGPGARWADPAPSDPLWCQGSELLLQRGVFQPSKYTPVPQKPAGPRSKSICPATLRDSAPLRRG